MADGEQRETDRTRVSAAPLPSVDPTGFLRLHWLPYHKELQMRKAECVLEASLLGVVDWLLLIGVCLAVELLVFCTC